MMVSLGKLVLQEAPSVVFSGLKQDQIAPNHYFEEGYNGNRNLEHVRPNTSFKKC